MSPPWRIAVVGAGLIGRRHVALARSFGWLAAIVDPNEATAELAEQTGAAWYSGLDGLLNDARLDGVILATPNRLHAGQALACIGHGLPVLIEKPITDTVENAAAVVAAASTAGVPVLVGHHRRHNPLIGVARHAINDGRIGRPTIVNAQFWLYKPDAYFRESWRSQQGAGPVFINLIHDIDLLRHLVGEIVEVDAWQSNAVRGFDVEDTAAILLRFANGALGTVTVSDTVVAPWSWEFASGENPAYPHTDVPSIAIGGTHGSLSVPDLRLWSHPGERSWWNPIESERLRFEPADPLLRQMAHFGEVIGGRANPLVPADEGLATLACVEAIKRSAETGESRTVLTRSVS